MTPNQLTLLVISDTHTIDRAQTPFPDSTRRCDLGNKLVERAIRDAQLTGGFDALALMGDLTEDGKAPGAEQDIAELEQRISQRAGDVPIMVVPGNHDPEPELCLQLFNDKPGMHRLGGYRFYSFVDQWDEENVGIRPPEQLRSFRQKASQESDYPLIVLQHNPLFPPIDDEYPFILSGNEALMKVYEDAGVLLSLSAHYHPGQQLINHHGVHYWTSPALSEPPFQYTLVHLRDRTVQIEPRRLQLPDHMPLTDVHAHTQYAYCAGNVTAREVVERAFTFGVTTQCLTEHADQLYMSREEHAAGLAINCPHYWNRPDNEATHRMSRYRQEMSSLRNQSVKLGTEIELDRDGKPGIHPDDLCGWDILLGSVHWLPGNLRLLSTEQINAAFLRNVRSLLQSGIDVLTHPFRFFRAADLSPPRTIYTKVADLLCQYGTAAELNFHHNTPDPEFFRCCLDKEVSIATGTDAHDLYEVGALWPHIRFLKDLIGPTSLSNILLNETGAANADIG